MLFNSFQFLLFLPVILALYFATPQRWRWVPLLIASFYFYMCWRPEYVVLILFSACIDYVVAILLDKTAAKTARRLLLLTSLVSNLGLLFFFKYYDFFVNSLATVGSAFSYQPTLPVLSLLLPLGISFYTFQALSYTIDVYRQEREAEHHAGYFMLYLMYFPQLVAGPIERSTRLLPQLREYHAFSWDAIKSGVRLVIWGLFVKMAVADRLAPVVDVIYNQPQAWSAGTLILGTIFFAFQIYCDFGGYSLIAIGCARMFGVDLMRNFAHPYLATNIIDFWRRWHISLSTWFRDYVYMPLGGNTGPRRRYLTNVMIVFLISGLWHGASWTFVIWGAFHGTWSILSRVTRDIRARIVNEQLSWAPVWFLTLYRTLFTFTMVCVGWIFFRAPTFADASAVLSGIFTGQPGTGQSLPFDERTMLANWMLVGIVIAWDFYGTGRLKFDVVTRAPVALRYAGALVLLLMFMMFANFGGHNFIYFQF
jgi:alginate O-acetyltransferase complex protein AlgI